MVLSRIRNTLKAFGIDRRGVAAVEFALIAPVGMVMMLGTIELGRAVVTARRFNLVTAVISDLVAREATMNDTELAAIATAATVMWQPYDAATLQFQVLQIRQSGPTATKIAANTNYVDWPKGFFGATVPAKCSLYTPVLPANMLSPGGVVIIVNGSYTYKPLLGTSLPFATATTWNWTSTSSHGPRNACVDYNVTNCLPTCE